VERVAEECASWASSGPDPGDPWRAVTVDGRDVTTGASESERCASGGAADGDLGQAGLGLVVVSTA